MSEASAAGKKRFRRIRHRGRVSQILIYLGKQLRFFINESDWKVLPMAAVIAALVVCKFGVIAFVGLLGPHLARMVVGDDPRYLIPTSALFGALLLMVANLVANNVMSPMVLPVGLLTSLLGGPVFIYLLIRRWRS